MKEMPNLVWVHSLFAGLDHILPCPEITDNEDITLTNAKGVFSSTLAEYAMAAGEILSINQNTISKL